MDNIEATKKEEKGNCVMCKFVRIFAIVAFLITALFLIITRFVIGAL